MYIYNFCSLFEKRGGGKSVLVFFFGLLCKVGHIIDFISFYYDTVVTIKTQNF